MKPPRIAEWLLRLSLPESDRTAVLGDLLEEFRERQLVDRRLARRWYWRQTAGSVIPNLRRRLAPAPAIVGPPGKAVFMSSIVQDSRFALRMLRRRPLTTTVAGLSLAVGIGMSAGVFSLLDAAVIRPLPVGDPDKLRVVLEQRPRSTNRNFNYPGYAAYRQVQRSFVDLVAFSPVAVALVRSDGSEVVNGELVSGSYFPTLGPPLMLGRGLTDVDMEPGAPPAVVLSRDEWRRLFGDAADLGGRWVRLNGQDFAIVGVAAAPFRGMEVGRDARFWAPLSAQPVLEPSAAGGSFLSRSTESWLTVMGRLRTGANDERATAELNAIGMGMTQPQPDGTKTTLFLAPGHQGDSNLAALVADPLRQLLGASLLVLLVACANVAGLLLARAGDRRGEIAMRTALGAGRWRIARLLLIESLALGVLGSAAGLVAALWVAPLSVPLFARFGEPVTLDIQLNWRVFLFAVSVGMVTAVAAGLAPMLRNWSRIQSTPLRDGGRSATAGARATRWRRGLVAAQFALTLGLVVAGGLLVRTLANLQSIPTGLDVDRVALIGVDPEAARYEVPRIRQYLSRVIEQVSTLPGVRAAGYGRVIPLGFGGSRMTVSVPGYAPAADEDMELNYNVVSPEYFDALGVAILEGRALDPADRPERPLAVVVNETLAQRYWADGRAVGRQLQLGTEGPMMDVVGMARDVKYRTLREDARPSFYLSVYQFPLVRGGIIHVRTEGDPADMLEALRRTVAGTDSAVPITQVRTLRQQLSLNVNRERVTMVIGLALGTTALLLSAVGLFGTVSAMVASRRRELGVRLALGAVPRQLARLVLREGLILAVWGGTAGIVLAIWLGRLIENQNWLYGVGSFDALSLATAVAVMSAVALSAAWLPARRAARVDPVETLRVE